MGIQQAVELADCGEGYDACTDNGALFRCIRNNDDAVNVSLNLIE
ncbi:hypothetical protein [Paenibacillus prosopidis]|nr:hypothetical protein [Paenibacillus prosopidis]